MNESVYSALHSSKGVFKDLIHNPKLPLLPEAREAHSRVILTSDTSQPKIPIIFKAGESIAALKALEASVALALAQARFGQAAQDITATVDANRAVTFFLMNFLSTVDGFNRWDAGEIAKRIRDTDRNNVYTNVYRRTLTNMYRTKDGRFFYLHAGLNADPTFHVLGLPLHNETFHIPQLAKNFIEARTLQLTSKELEDKIVAARQAGSICLTRAEFLATPHGKHISQRPLIELETLETSSPPLKLSTGASILSHVKVLDLTRVIAGPVITRTLAEYGADIIRVTNLKLPDATYYQIDFNFGKRTVDLDLKSQEGRAAFEKLLDDVDVIVNGYRPGALAKLGYGPQELLERFKNRGKGFVYVAENCYGWGGPWSERPGWQQIADSVSGLSWANGQALGKNEPVAPPFPLADFGTGELGCIAALNALHHRFIRGGSYYTTVSLVQFNLWLMSLGQYDDELWAKMLSDHDIADKINCHSNFDRVGIVAHGSMRRLHPELWQETYMHSADAHFGHVRTHAPVVQMPFKSGWLNPTRWSGWDQPSWLPN